MRAKLIPSMARICSMALCPIAASSALGGDLNPPPGPVAPTMKTLMEVEPRIAVNAANTPGDADSVFYIVQPGSYYLTGNLAGESGKHGIQIAADNVTLDLMGFELAGVAGSLDGANSVLITVLNYGITIRNGTVTGWGNEGVDLSISVGGACADLIVTGNAGTGIKAPIGSTVARCTARQNGAGGISGGSVMRDCYASNNTGDGISGGSVVENCSSGVNTGNGFISVGRVDFLNCLAGGNDLAGFSIGNTGVAKGCDASQNDGSGFILNNGAMAVDCSSTSNGGDGFTLVSSATVRGCNARLNALDGIRADAACLIVGNHCVSNGPTGGTGSGVRVTGANNRVEGNNATSNSRGIHVTGAGNMVLSNSASDNGTFNYDIVIGNAYGQVVSAMGAQAVQGNSGPVNGVNSTNPWANFAY